MTNSLRINKGLSQITTLLQLRYTDKTYYHKYRAQDQIIFNIIDNLHRLFDRNEEIERQQQDITTDLLTTIRYHGQDKQAQISHYRLELESERILFEQTVKNLREKYDKIIQNLTEKFEQTLINLRGQYDLLLDQRYILQRNNNRVMEITRLFLTAQNISNITEYNWSNDPTRKRRNLLEDLRNTFNQQIQLKRREFNRMPQKNLNYEYELSVRSSIR